ncbi:sugar ABC transporter substrate-binding protein [Nocardioides sp.]|jgi:D-xylose transport system substrate-binding protein|uniref:sugar ABC transporter substrate-binding protein n=1 Tax=Nocardioides sp. TaxID=35761 RepID=UPI002B67C0F4|nr:substrate-binding domain-containing protein [Nocardioides sp.]HVX54467.1 substrate-binding domain-containing protein [Nocardioides sp.]
MNTRKGARVASLCAAGVLAFGALAACGSSGNNSASSGSTGSSNGGGGSSKADVGVILPDATTSPRWESQDRPNLQKAFDAAGLKSDIQNAQGDTAKFGQLCDSMINEGVAVLMITNLDSDSGAACLKKAADAGVQTIDYDRLTLGGGASYYVSFDNVKVGQLMGQGLVDALKKEGKNSGNVVEVDGASTDNNAALFKQGYDSVLKANPQYKIVGDQSGNWDATKAGQVFDQMYTQNKGNIDGAIVANDTMSGGVIARLKADGVAGKIPTTGQDASVEGLQNILRGYQAGTVYKNTTLEADAASKLAIDLIKGDKSAAAALATGTVQDTKLNKAVPSVLATPVWITADTVKQVVSDGQADASQICTGDVAKLCKKYGVQ